MSDTQPGHTTALILAAGKSTRMKSATPKTLHAVAGLPILGHVLKTVEQAGVAEAVLVVAPDMDAVTAYARSVRPDIAVAVQDAPLGTGDAVKSARNMIAGGEGVVLIVFGDTPLLRAETLTEMAKKCREQADIVVLGFHADDPTGYGRLVLGPDGDLRGIVEHKDASPAERALTLCNGGAMAVRAPVLPSLLDGLTNEKHEVYLTDIVALGRGQGLDAAVIDCPEEETMGVDSRAGLAAAETLMQQRLRRRAFDAGVTLLDPDTVYLSADTVLGRDVTVGPNVVFGSGVAVGEGATIKPFSHLEGAQVAAGAVIGPFARLRPGADIGEGARIGNFVEIKQARVEQGAKVNHLSYIGDARVGAAANIGAGTITCNYDGFNKHFTDIGAGAFVGSNSALVAPVKIGDGAYLGSGSVITHDVADDALAVARGRQIGRGGWAAAFRARHDTSGKDTGRKKKG